MNRKFILLFSALAFFSLLANAQPVNENLTVAWKFDQGTQGQVATYTGTTDTLFKPDHVAVGSNLAYVDANTTSDVTYTRFQPAAQLGGASEDCEISFNLWPKKGLSFVPTKISFNTMRYGTGGGLVDVGWRTADGTVTTLATGIKPIRNNEPALDSTASSFSVDITSGQIAAIEGEGALVIYLYSLANNKQVGFANLYVEGTVSGTLIIVPTFTVNSAVEPAGAGTISSSPVGTVFDENTEITLTAARNFGYQFLRWEDAGGNSVSTDNAYTFTATANADLKAVYEAINTYSLDVMVDGGASDYMVDISPAGTMVGNKRMYEEGTTVSLGANENQVLSFTNWNNGQTSSLISVSMTENKSVTASYSATDFIVAWDFYKSGNSSRVADFYSVAENQSAAVVLQAENGTLKSWLDKSTVSAGGYEGQAAAVNWNPLADKYYYQMSFDASEFESITVQSSMLFNYNAYSVQNLEYSLDGTTWTGVGTITMDAAKVWYQSSVTLPSAADHAAKVYFRWIPDYTSSVLGTSSANDGTALSQIYVTGKQAIQNDGTAPVLVATIPATDATGASATGKIVLTFDEKVKVADGAVASLGSKSLSPMIAGKTITFAYTGLDYGTAYTFTLPANAVADLGDNALADPISINFTTLVRPTVTKKAFDFVVGVDGDFKQALEAANTASASGERFYIFFPDGEYNIGELTGDGNQMTAISIPNVSYVGQSSDKVILYNKSINESINSTATIYFTDASSNIYMQDISLMNKMDYRTGTLVGRGVALWDQGKKNIYKNVKLLSNQDTYYSGSDRSYFETSEIHGTVDFICGGGDIFFNQCLIYLEERGGNVISAPATGSNWGYVFSNCTIDGFDINNGGYRLGRPWSNAPKSVFINTTMKVLPTAEAWGDPMNVVPAVFAEYNSMTSSGASVDLSNRRTNYTKDAISVTLDPTLTEAQAAEYTIENVLGGADAWIPQLYTEQSAAPVVSIDKATKTLSWGNSDYVLCWGVFNNGAFVGFTTDTSYAIPANVDAGIFTVRAANQMGGLSAPSNSIVFDQTLVAHWTFNDGAGTNVADVLGSSNGTLVNGADANWVNGYMGKALDFTSKVSQDTTIFVSATSSETSFDSTQSFTLSVIVKGDIAAGGEQSILSKGMPYVDNGGWYHLSYKAGAARFMIWDDVEQKMTSPAGKLPATFPQNDWVHIVCVRDRASDLAKVYVNGELLDQIADITEYSIATDGQFFVGSVPNFGTQLNGQVDEVQVYKRALSAEEIMALSADYGFSSLLPSKANDATLSELYVSGIAVDGFTPATTSYTLTLPRTTVDVPAVTGVTSNLNAKVDVTPATDLSGSTTVVVTAVDGTTQTYTVSYELEVSSDATLSALSLSVGDLSPAFSPSETNYTAQVPEGTTSVDVMATATDALATVTGAGAVDVTVVGAKAVVKVTAGNQSVKTYVISFSVTSSIANMGAGYQVVYSSEADALILSGVDRVQVFAVSGVKLLEKVTPDNYLSLSSLQSGAYIVRAQTAQKLVTVKIVK